MLTCTPLAESTNEAKRYYNNDSAMEEDIGIGSANKGGEADQVEASVEDKNGQREEEADSTV